MILRVKKELQAYLSDNTHAWLLQSDGSYQHILPHEEKAARNAQALLIEKLSIPLIEVV
jgi:polyphosphate kinase